MGSLVNNLILHKFSFVIAGCVPRAASLSHNGLWPNTLSIPLSRYVKDLNHSLPYLLCPTIVQKIRENATLALERAASENFSVYMSTLCGELCDENKPSEVRQAAGVALKNALVSRDEQVRSAYAARWLGIDPAARQRMRDQLLHALGSPVAKAGTAAAQAIAAVAFVELPAGQWAELMGRLVEVSTAAQSPQNLRRAAIETIGFICEQIEPAVLETRSNEILTAVINGLRTDELAPSVQAAAATALLHSIEFVRTNFARPTERDIIMSVVCNATQAADDAIRLPAYECLTRIVTLYYPQLASYMKAGLAALTIAGLGSSVEHVVMAAIEFWSTMADIERDLLAAESAGGESGGHTFECLYFTRDHLPQLLPALLPLLRRQPSEDADEDEWNVAMAAGTCLSLLAECVRNDIFTGDLLVSFVRENIGQTGDWRAREAALMAYGSVMDGPTEMLEPLITQGLPVVLGLLKDPSVACRDTAAWAVGRVVDFWHELIPASLLGSVITGLVQGVEDAPRVASNCSWSLMSLAVHYGHEEGVNDQSGNPSSSLSSHWTSIAGVLLAAATGRSDGEENNLRTAAFQALATLVQYAPGDCAADVGRLQVTLVGQLGESQRLADMIVNVDDRMRYSDLQAALCTVLAASVRKLGRPSLALADQLMAAVMIVFGNAARGKGSATELEDVFMLVGTIVGEMEETFERFLDPFMPVLTAAMANVSETHLCAVALGVAGDLARALGPALVPYADQLVGQLLQAAQCVPAYRQVKPHALNALGDVALALTSSGASTNGESMSNGTGFVKYIESVMYVLGGAAREYAEAMASLNSVPIDEDLDYDEVDYWAEVAEALLAALTSLIQGAKEDPGTLAALAPHVGNTVLGLVQAVANDGQRTEAMERAAIGLVGDVAAAYGSQGQLRALLGAEWLRSFIARPLQEQDAVSEATLSVARWTQSVWSKLR